MTLTTDSAVRCSTWTREQSVDPVGTAGFYRGYLLIEVPLPWPRDVGQIAEIEAVAALTDVQGYRIQALVPSQGASERRVILHSPPPAPAGSEGWFGGYVRTEAVAGDDLAATVASIVSPTKAGGAVEAGAQPVDPPVDLLVCTHGRRDVCCGSLGTELALDLAGRGWGRGRVELWRTSHTGGHRFAPTFLVLPAGSLWAYADAALVDAVINRTVAFRDVSHHYRGCAGLGPAPVQALEREVMRQVGWELLDRPRRGYETGEASALGGSLYRLETEAGAWEAVVRPGRTVAVPDCMRPLSDARKTETEWVVSDLRPA